MWFKSNKTKAGVPMVVDQYNKEVIVFIDFSSQKLIVFQEIYSTEIEAKNSYAKQVAWVKGLEEAA